jgi:AraC-like DNA-binding protein
MVSERCKISVNEILDSIGLIHKPADLGEVDIESPVSAEQIRQFRNKLLSSGFELMEDMKTALVEKIVDAIMKMVHGENDRQTIYSNYLSSILHHDYTYLAKTFSAVKGLTIEHFIIMQKIERVKALLVSGGQSLTDIALKLNYSSTAHLSTQFKKITGFTPTDFKLGLKETGTHQKDL